MLLVLLLELLLTSPDELVLLLELLLELLLDDELELLELLELLLLELELLLLELELFVVLLELELLVLLELELLLLELELLLLELEFVLLELEDSSALTCIKIATAATGGLLPSTIADVTSKNPLAPAWPCVSVISGTSCCDSMSLVRRASVPPLGPTRT